MNFKVLFLELVILIKGIAALENSTKVTKPKTPLHHWPGDFRKVVNSSIFLDRSLFIEEVFKHGSVFITAPQGFGKTTNFDMLKLFLEIEEDERGEPKEMKTTTNYELFMRNKLNIFKNKTFFNEHFGKYPVMYLDYSDLCLVTNFKSMLVLFGKILRASYLKYKYLTSIEPLWYSEGETMVFSKFTSSIKSKQLDIYDVKFGFEWLPEILYRHFKKKVFILIDEYDTYIKHILNKENPEEHLIFDFIRSINTVLLIDNRYLDRALLTGETIDTDGVSALRYLKIVNILYHSDFCNYYGLQEVELDEILTKLVKDNTKRQKTKQICDDERKIIKVRFKKRKVWSYFGYPAEKSVYKLFSYRPVLYCLGKKRKRKE